MKHTKWFLIFALALVESVYAGEDTNFSKDPANTVVAIAEVENINPEEKSKNDPQAELHDLFAECYRNNNARACQQLLTLAAKKNSIDKIIASYIISAQQQTIATHEETIKIFNELNKRRNKRIKQRKENRKKEFSNSL